MVKQQRKFEKSKVHSQKRVRKLTNIYVDLPRKKKENIEVTKLGMKEGTLI